MKPNLGSILFVLALATGCAKKGDDQKAAGDKSADDAPGLAMSSDSPACKKAMTCCEKKVEALDPPSSPDKVNLSCSGVAMAKADADCDAFKKGYAEEITSKGKEAPAECM